MASIDTLKIIDNNEVNRKLWDECINSDANNLIYGRSFYLDHISPSWKAITAANYEWVIPVTCKKKYGISYLYQPTFTQQLGVFSKPFTSIPYHDIVSCLQKHYRFWEINWNYKNVINIVDEKLKNFCCNKFCS